MHCLSIWPCCSTFEIQNKNSHSVNSTMIFAICSFLRLASSLRLVTLPPLDKKGDGIFIKNDSLKLKLERVNQSNILDMYVVVHSRKVYFYNRGSYYGFGYDSDNVALKLVPVPVGKVHYFTQETIDQPRPKRTRWRRAVKRNGDDSNTSVKTIKTIKYTSEKEALEDESTSHVANAPYFLRSRAPGEGCSTGDEVKCEKVHDAGSPGPRADYGTLFKNLGEILRGYKNPVQRAVDTREKDIESDSEMLDSRSLDIEIEMVNQREKTFVLKNGRNLCVTYFQKLFIMAACTKSKRQTFKLVEAEDVASRLKGPAEGRNVSAFDDIVMKEESSSSSSEEKSAGEFFEAANKKINEKLRERLGGGSKHKKSKEVKVKTKDAKEVKKGKHKDAKRNKHKEDSEVRSHAPSSTSVAPQEPSSENSEVSKTKSNKHPEPEPSSVANPTLPKFVPMPRRIDEYCRDMYNRSMGQINRLPEECLVFFGFRMPAPLPAFKRTARFPVSIPQGSRVLKVSKLPKGPILKVAEDIKPKSEPLPAATAEQQNINVIEKLERALGTDTFFK